MLYVLTNLEERLRICSTDIKVQVVLDRWNFSLRCNFFFNYHNRNLGLCRVPFIGHSTKEALPRAALGEVLLSVTSWFTECRTLGTGKLSAKTCLPSVKHSAKVALGKGPVTPGFQGSKTRG
jgi:hypothetical protein